MTKVYVVDAGRKFYYLQWVDPHTGKRVTRSSKETTRRGAERKALLLENQLSKENSSEAANDWESFVDYYQHQHLSGLAAKSEDKSVSVLDQFAAAMKPSKVGDITTVMLSRYAAKMRSGDNKRTEATIAGHLKTIRAALSWAKDQGYIAEIPRIPKIARSMTGRKMKGRPLTNAEFAKMLQHTSEIVTRKCGRSWRRLLRGLWLSGMRLQEAMNLTWDDPSKTMVDTAGAFPMLRVVASEDKAFRDRTLPITPDFGEWLLRTPPDRRAGHVFAPMGEKGHPVYSEYHVSRTISLIGKAAKIVVDARSGKFASAHDLRRSFGSRWARKETPQVLRELMRHANIATTMAFYVELEAEQTASDLWKKYGGK